MASDDKPTRSRQQRPESPTPWRVEGVKEGQDGSGSGSDQGGGGFRPPGGLRRFGAVLLVLLALNFVFASLVPNGPDRNRVEYTFFLDQVDRGNVDEVAFEGLQVVGEFKRPVKEPDAGSDVEARKEFRSFVPAIATDDRQLLEQLREKDVRVSAEPADDGRSFIGDLLLFFGPTLLLVALFIFLARRAAGGAAGGLTGLGRSKAKRYDATQQRVSFGDVAGIDEAEDELVEIVDFLRNPDKYRKLGAMIPKGVLLSGPPGTGKTLLARAVAGEADVPFFSISASEFIEMVVGVGASRVRDLFDQAKKAAPAIIFIDELDAIGRQRGGGASVGGHDEREQTLNQILTEMDGFTGSEGVIVLAATNRPDVLDQALLRPGRFDRRLTVNPPDADGRRQILEIHTRSVPLDDEVDLAQLASTTPGMVGADLRNLVNEAALLAARREHDQVRSEDFFDAFEKIVLGAERKITLSEEERERTAYHEAGHALLGMLEPGADPVRKVSIVPRGRALGVTFQSPESDRYGYDTAYLLGRITGALGGRAAEELVYGTITTGAESDLEQVTRIARSMVGRWGMSEEIGLVTVVNDDAPFAMPGSEPASEATRELVDREVRRIVEGCYGRALDELRDHRPQLDALAQALLERETLDEADAYAAAGFERGTAPGDQGPKGMAIAERVDAAPEGATDVT
ncbi:ATP-dependent zinc metalloprotease FtsH [Conexibacter sp. SYSU D00693]|uniref:ATP-dependent zinc metalloprotease FtsH n=1 Tax=Conexibacter sp. SYSU D00693 TaxID=2812560 RepID=UPI00196B164A|nr:ATP-dependent zinc metalloprotease FtsH [Conexibacter sp. SYSU D00693]